MNSAAPSRDRRSLRLGISFHRLPRSSRLHISVPAAVKGRRAARCGLHEIKHDGYRLQIHLRDGRVRLFTRSGADWSNRYPWIIADASRLPVSQAVMDAECCCAGPDGVTDFYRSGRAKSWIKTKNKNAAAYTRVEDGTF